MRKKTFQIIALSFCGFIATQQTAAAYGCNWSAICYSATPHIIFCGYGSRTASRACVPSDHIYDQINKLCPGSPDNPRYWWWGPDNWADCTHHL